MDISKYIKLVYDPEGEILVYVAADGENFSRFHSFDFVEGENYELYIDSLDCDLDITIYSEKNVFAFVVGWNAAFFDYGSEGSCRVSESPTLIVEGL